MIERIPYTQVWRELSASKSMLFMAGPRQCGKTTLARRLAMEYKDSLYLNWDFVADRKKILNEPDFLDRLPRTGPDAPLVIFDEIHKHRRWKSYLKGIYDVFHDRFRFLISGSGRLDLYQRGGDSLAGRYELFHLWPLTLAELSNTRINMNDFLQDPIALPREDIPEYRAVWEGLLAHSGFPEPYLADSDAKWRRWSRGYSRQLIREDIRDLSDIKKIDLVETLYALLPDRVGSLLSLNAMAEILQVSYNTVKAWVEVLERFYLVFCISPWSKRLSRALKKERKMYLFDTPLIENIPARIENAVALELHRAVTMWNDLGWGSFSLHYARNKEKEEVDFVVADKNRPLLLVEVKSTESEPSPALKKIQAQLQAPAVLLTNRNVDPRWYTGTGGRILVSPAWRWLAQLP